MKKIILSLFSAMVILSACKKENDAVFDKTPDERINDTLAKYQSLLAGAENGWKASLRVDSGRGATFTFYFKFNNQNRVQMVASIDSTSASTLKESSYRLKALQQPSLLFDTYSYLHVLSDPDASVNGGAYGIGLISDFEFLFTSATADSITLTGRMHGSKAVLVRATQAEATAFSSGQLANGLLINKIQTYYKRLTIGSASLDFYFDPIARNIKWTDNNGNLLDPARRSDYNLVLGGLTFTSPFTLGNQTISRISNLNYVASTQTITCTVNNNIAATITEVTVPLKIDVNAPSRWWNYAVSNQTFYVSINGFHVNGINDAYNLHSIPGYDFLYFEPKFGTSGSITYDLLGPVVNNSLNYGAAFRPPTFANGLVTFRYLGDLGSVPNNQIAIYTATVSKFIDGSGYYLVQTGASTYDMVSARDSKSWISWLSLQ